MRIVRFLPITAISLATGLWFSGAAFAGGVYNPATPIVDSDRSLVVSAEPVHYKKRKVRRHSRNRQHRSRRRRGNNFSFGFGYGDSPYYYSRRQYYPGYSYYRPYGYYGPYSHYRYRNY